MHFSLVFGPSSTPVHGSYFCLQGLAPIDPSNGACKWSLKTSVEGLCIIFLRQAFRIISLTLIIIYILSSI
jgi:hypothetical protein